MKQTAHALFRDDERQFLLPVFSISPPRALHGVRLRLLGEGWQKQARPDRVNGDPGEQLISMNARGVECISFSIDKTASRFAARSVYRG
jgi:hypothetical protein